MKGDLGTFNDTENLSMCNGVATLTKVSTRSVDTMKFHSIPAKPCLDILQNERKLPLCLD